MVQRPDQSRYLAHFAKDGKSIGCRNNHGSESKVDKMTALEKLVNILEERTILATTMPWTNIPAVCFTECPWSSLLQHSKQYSPYGIGFSKEAVYLRNGNPVIYANPDLYNEVFSNLGKTDDCRWSDRARGFFTPFVPTYASNEKKEKLGKVIDYTHEREWRTLEPFSFDYSDIAFIILKEISDLNALPEEIVEEVGVDKFLFMDTYRKIEELWPTHLV